MGTEERGSEEMKRADGREWLGKLKIRDHAVTLKHV